LYRRLTLMRSRRWTGWRAARAPSISLGFSPARVFWPHGNRAGGVTWRRLKAAWRAGWADLLEELLRKMLQALQAAVCASGWVQRPGDGAAGVQWMEVSP
jgi:hypothetical protein